MRASEICGDVNVSGGLSTSDALLVLRGSVGQPVTLTCPSIEGLTTCQSDLTGVGNQLFTCTEDKEECFSDKEECISDRDEYFSEKIACLTAKDACLSSLEECLQATCGDDDADRAEQCDGEDLRGHSCATWTPLTPYGKLACDDECGMDSSGCNPRFELREKTIMDYKTGLEWERKHGADGEIELDDPNDADNLYSWGSTSPPYPPTGTLFVDFLAKLNGGLGAATCLAGHCDWRIPSEAEFLSIIDTTIPDCGTAVKPCIDSLFLPLHGFEQANWTSTTFAANPTGAREAYLYSGDTFTTTKTLTDPARAVRTAFLP